MSELRPDRNYSNIISLFVYTTIQKMLVKVNNIDASKNKVKVTKLDIDDYGSIIPLEELELKLPQDDNSIIQILENSSYAAIFTEGNIDDDNSTIVLANAMTVDELNKEKSNTIDAAENKERGNE